MKPDRSGPWSDAGSVDLGGIVFVALASVLLGSLALIWAFVLR